MSKLGSRIVGRCYLPCRTFDHGSVGNAYEFKFPFRSNFGGLRQFGGFNLKLVSGKKTYLKISANELLNSSNLPIKIKTMSEDFSQLSQGRAALTLIKPNKHHLKTYETSISCHKGVLKIPLFLKAEDQVEEAYLLVYPAVFEQVEYLVIESYGLPIQLVKNF